MTKKPNAILLYSGGMDSLIAWHYLQWPPTLYVDLGHRYNRKEMEAIHLLPPSPIMRRSFYGFYYEQEDAHIPGRNLILAMFAAGMGFDTIYLVAQLGEQNLPDRSPAFFEETSKLLTFHFDRVIEMANPGAEWYKHEMVRWYIENDLPIEDLLISVSCYSNLPGHCGACSSCWRKYVALTYNGISCADLFDQDIRAWGREKYGSRLGEYDEARRFVMEEVLK